MSFHFKSIEKVAVQDTHNIVLFKKRSGMKRTEPPMYLGRSIAFHRKSVDAGVG
jgi:hypothetical protein